MKVFGYIILSVIVFVLIGITILHKPKNTELVSGPQMTSIVGCYVFKADKNVYTLNLQTQNGLSVAGTLRFDNFQFDDSSGTFVGTYENDILLGDYSFTSEGMDSVTQHIFKRSGDNFVQGTGEYTTNGNRQTLVDPNSVTWEQNRVFIKSPCI